MTVSIHLERYLQEHLSKANDGQLQLYRRFILFPTSKQIYHSHCTIFVGMGCGGVGVFTLYQQTHTHPCPTFTQPQTRTHPENSKIELLNCRTVEDSKKTLRVEWSFRLLHYCFTYACLFSLLVRVYVYTYIIRSLYYLLIFGQNCQVVTLTPSVERSFSQLSRIKSYCRSTMKQNRLNRLCCCIHS